VGQNPQERCLNRLFRPNQPLSRRAPLSLPAKERRRECAAAATAQHCRRKQRKWQRRRNAPAATSTPAEVSAASGGTKGKSATRRSTK